MKWGIRNKRMLKFVEFVQSSQAVQFAEVSFCPVECVLPCRMSCPVEFAVPCRGFCGDRESFRLANEQELQLGDERI